MIKSITAIGIFTSGLRRMNDIEKPGYFLFLPFYNIHLLLQAGNAEKTTFINKNEDNFQNDKGFRFITFLKVFIASISVGILNLLIIGVVSDSLYTNMNDGIIYMLIIISAVIVPFSFIVNGTICSCKSNYILLKCFLLTLLLSVLTTAIFLYFANKHGLWLAG